MSAQKPQDQYIKVGNINTRFWVAGDKGTPVILIHGGGCCVESWEHNFNALAEYHRVYALDLVGFGRSDRPDVQYTLSYFAQFVRDFIQAQHIERASLVGYSIPGGGVALQLATQFPEKLEKLVLVDSIGLGKEVAFAQRLLILPIIGEFLLQSVYSSKKSTAQVLKAAVRNPAVITDKDAEHLHQILSLPNAKKSFLSACRSFIGFSGCRKDVTRSIVNGLSTITAPTLVIWGQQDRIIPVAHAQVAKERIPNVKLHIFDPCGHIPQLERPEEFNNLVLEFLAV